MSFLSSLKFLSFDSRRRRLSKLNSRKKSGINCSKVFVSDGREDCDGFNDGIEETDGDEEGGFVGTKQYTVKYLDVFSIDKY